MKVRGPNYRVKFVRQKEQTQYRWKANENWVLAVYHVQEFEISDDPDKTKECPWDEKVELQLKQPKTEIEVHETHNNSCITRCTHAQSKCVTHVVVTLNRHGERTTF